MLLTAPGGSQLMGCCVAFIDARLHPVPSSAQPISAALGGIRDQTGNYTLMAGGDMRIAIKASRMPAAPDVVQRIETENRVGQWVERPMMRNGPAQTVQVELGRQPSEG